MPCLIYSRDIDEWIKYDDDKVSIVNDKDIQKLDGGGM